MANPNFVKQALSMLRGNEVQPLHVLSLPEALVRIEMIEEVTGLDESELRSMLPAPIRINGRDRWTARVVMAFLREQAEQ